MSKSNIPGGYKALGYTILTGALGWAAKAAPSWVLPLMIIGLCSVVASWVAFLLEDRGRINAARRTGRGKSAGGEGIQFSSWLHSASDVLMAVLLFAFIALTIYLAYVERHRGVKFGFRDQPVASVSFQGEESGVPRNIIVVLTAFVQNTAIHEQAFWIWRELSPSSKKRVPWEWEGLGGYAFSGAGGGAGARVERNETKEPGQYRVQVASISEIQAGPTAPIHNPVTMMFRVEHRDRQRFLRELIQFPCCPCIDLAVNSYVYRSGIFDIERKEERTDCFPDVRGAIAEKYLAVVKMSSDSDKKREQIAEVEAVVKRIGDETCGCSRSGPRRE